MAIGVSLLGDTHGYVTNRKESYGNESSGLLAHKFNTWVEHTWVEPELGKVFNTSLLADG